MESRQASRLAVKQKKKKSKKKKKICLVGILNYNADTVFFSAELLASYKDFLLLQFLYHLKEFFPFPPLHPYERAAGSCRCAEESARFVPPWHTPAPTSITEVVRIYGNSAHDHRGEAGPSQGRDYCCCANKEMERVQPAFKGSLVARKLCQHSLDATAVSCLLLYTFKKSSLTSLHCGYPAFSRWNCSVSSVLVYFKSCLTLLHCGYHRKVFSIFY